MLGVFILLSGTAISSSLMVLGLALRDILDGDSDAVARAFLATALLAIQAACIVGIGVAAS